MPRGSERRTHYQVLGVRPDASAAEIRNAYVQLMKCVHPDVVDGAATAAERGQIARIINERYAILKDVGKRANYDAEQDHARKLIRSRTKSNPALTPRMAAFLCASVIGISAFILLQDKPTTFAASALANWRATPARSLQDAADEPLPDMATVRLATRLAATTPLPEAELYSRQCFDQTVGQTNIGAAEPCVLFDIALLYWQVGLDANAERSAYFGDPAVGIRHSRALARFGTESEHRLISLHQVALRTLLMDVQESTDALIEREESATSPHQSEMAASDYARNTPVPE